MKNKYIENEKLSLFLFLAAAIVQILISMTKNCFSAAMVLLVEEQILTKTQTGTISALFYLVYAPFQIVGGFAADRFSPFALISVGLFGSMAANTAIYFSQSYTAMLIISAINGAIQFGVWPSLFKICSSMLAPSHRQKAVFYISVCYILGSVASFLVAGMVSTWKSNFSVSAVAIGLCLIAWVISGKTFKRNLKEETIEMVKQESIQGEKPHSFLKLLFSSGLFIMLPGTLLASVFSVGVQSVIPSMLKENYHAISASVASLLNAFPLIAGLAGKTSMLFVYRKKTRDESLVMTVCMASLLFPIGVMCFMGKVHVWVILIMTCLILLISNASNIAYASYLPMRFAKVGKTATVSGIINSTASLGIVMASFISPLVADSLGWDYVIYLWMLFAFCASLLFFISFFFWRRFIKN